MKILGEKYMVEKYVQEESLGEKYMGGKSVQEEFLGEESLGEEYMIVYGLNVCARRVSG